MVGSQAVSLELRSRRTSSYGPSATLPDLCRASTEGDSLPPTEAQRAIPYRRVSECRHTPSPGLTGGQVSWSPIRQSGSFIADNRKLGFKFPGILALSALCQTWIDP